MAVYFDKNRRGEYFDSYGLPPAVLGLEAYTDRFSLDWIYNRKRYKAYFQMCADIIVCILFYFVVVISLCMQYYLSLP